MPTSTHDWRLEGEQASLVASYPSLDAVEPSLRILLDQPGAATRVSIAVRQKPLADATALYVQGGRARFWGGDRRWSWLSATIAGCGVITTGQNILIMGSLIQAIILGDPEQPGSVANGLERLGVPAETARYGAEQVEDGNLLLVLVDSPRRVAQAQRELARHGHQQLVSDGTGEDAPAPDGGPRHPLVVSTTKPAS